MARPPGYTRMGLCSPSRRCSSSTVRSSPRRRGTPCGRTSKRRGGAWRYRTFAPCRGAVLPCGGLRGSGRQRRPRCAHRRRRPQPRGSLLARHRRRGRQRPARRRLPGRPPAAPGHQLGWVTAAGAGHVAAGDGGVGPAADVGHLVPPPAPSTISCPTPASGARCCTAYPSCRGRSSPRCCPRPAGRGTPPGTFTSS
jgi:hypothetical protein